MCWFSNATLNQFKLENSKITISIISLQDIPNLKVGHA